MHSDLANLTILSEMTMQNEQTFKDDRRVKYFLITLFFVAVILWLAGFYFAEQVVPGIDYFPAHASTL